MNITQGKEYKAWDSRFFAFFAEVNSEGKFWQFMEKVKQKHKNDYCDHFVYAYRVLEAQHNMFLENKIIEKYSNAGEPSGTGRALLGLLQDNSKENCALIVVRYFGGTLLGAENVPKAYLEAARKLFVSS